MWNIMTYVRVTWRVPWNLEGKRIALVKFDCSLSCAKGNERGWKYVEFDNSKKSGKDI